jgi:hypothetical protein
MRTATIIFVSITILSIIIPIPGCSDTNSKTNIPFVVATVKTTNFSIKQADQITCFVKNLVKANTNTRYVSSNKPHYELNISITKIDSLFVVTLNLRNMQNNKNIRKSINSYSKSYESMLNSTIKKLVKNALNSINK